jgi:hypothetical protein
MNCSMTVRSTGRRRSNDPVRNEIEDPMRPPHSTASFAVRLSIDSIFFARIDHCVQVCSERVIHRGTRRQDVAAVLPDVIY